MNLREYLRRLREAQRELARTQTKRAVGVAMDTLAQTKRRVQSGGRNYRGQTFVGYTRLYAQRRTADGYQTGYVDFTRTGRLWNSINPEARQTDFGKTVVELRPRDSENQTKLDGQFAKRGNILRPSEQEITLARQIWQRRALQILRPIR